jgi:hypothetical protein
VVKAAGMLDGARGLLHGLVDGRTQLVAAAVAVGGCLVIILGLRAVAPRVPGILIAVVLATLVVTFVGAAGSIAVVGVVPRGLPLPSLRAVCDRLRGGGCAWGDDRDRHCHRGIATRLRAPRMAAS